MDFLRRLFGGGKPGDAQPGLPGSPTPSLGKAPPPASVSSPPPERDDAPAPRRRYLEYIAGSSAKFYAVVLDPGADDRWRVRSTFGRIGTKRDWGVRIDGVSFPTARAAYEALLAEKEGKGYEVRPWPGKLQLAGAKFEAEETQAPIGMDDQVLFRANRRGELPPED